MDISEWQDDGGGVQRRWGPHRDLRAAVYIVDGGAVYCAFAPGACGPIIAEDGGTPVSIAEAKRRCDVALGLVTDWPTPAAPPLEAPASTYSVVRAAQELIEAHEALEAARARVAAAEAAMLGALDAAPAGTTDGHAP